MKLTAASVVTEALDVLRRDHQLLIALAGPFWFLPAYAIALFVPAPPARPAEASGMLAWTDQFGQWLGAHGPWYLLASAIGLWGTATVYSLYLRPGRPDLRTALREAGTVWPRLLLASALVAMMAAAGLLLWVLPGLYLLGRLLPVGPALTAERPLSALAAIGRGFRLSRGNGLALTAVTAATLGMGWIAAQPLLLLDGWMRAQHGGNPVAIALVDAGAAAVSAVAALAGALIAVAAYRRLAR